MMVINEPVTTGGKSFFNLEKTQAIRKTMIPAAMIAPYI